MLIDEIREKGSIGSGKWRVNAFLRNEAYWQIYSVSNGMGKTAEMRTVLLPTEEMVNDYEGMYGPSEHTNDMIIADLERQLDILFKTLEKVRTLSAGCEGMLKVYDFGNFISSEGYCCYAVTEAAEPADSFLARTTLNTGMVLKLGQDIAEALSACEKNYLLHGYIDNNNIFINNEGAYKLGNFGMDGLFRAARLRQDRAAEYCAAPEAVMNRDRSNSGDIYSLGMVMYKLFNFNRVPFLPSKDEHYSISSHMMAQAYQRRLSGEDLPDPLYADKAVSEIIRKCCAFKKEERYHTAAELSADLSNAAKTQNMKQILEYPNFAAYGGQERPAAGKEKMAVNQGNQPEYQASSKNNGGFVSNYFEGVKTTASENAGGQTKETEDENAYTMGAQSYYTDALGSIGSNRQTEADEGVLDNIDVVRQKIAEKYGAESKEFLKFNEKLRNLEEIKDNNQVLQAENKKRANIIKILCGAAAAAIVLGVVVMLNSTTYYINQGQYNRIYKRTLFGSTECFKEVAASNLEKDSSDLYYINTGDQKIYRVSTKNGADEETIGDGTALMFRIEGKYLYYINTSDGNKLYRTNLSDGTTECVYDKDCVSISSDDGDIRIITSEDQTKPMILDTKTLEVTEAESGSDEAENTEES